ncbi:MAG: DNA polymerase III subunit beta [Thermoplasmatales archaeon]
MNIKKAIDIANRVVTKSILFPVSQNVLIDHDKVMRTNLSVEVVLNLDNPVIEAAILVDCLSLKRILDRTVTPSFSLKNDRLVITDDGSVFILPVEDPLDYPRFSAEGETKAEFELNFKTISKLKFALDKPKLDHVCSRFCIDTDYAVTTDRYRLAAKRITTSLTKQIVVSPDFIYLVAYMTEDSVGVTVDDSFVTVNLGEGVIRARIDDEKYPDWKGVIPNTDDMNQFVIEARDLMDVMQKVMVFRTEKESFCQLDLSRKRLTVSMETPKGFSEISCPVDVKKVQQETQLLIDGVFLLEAVNYVIDAYSPDEELVISYIPSKPMMITLKRDPKEMIQLIMPARR